MTILVQQYFSESAKRFPEKTAIGCAGKSVTFRQAGEFSNSVANTFRSLGVQRGQFIPFFMRKSVDSILSILSILKTDCAYVPIDTGSPQSRALSILELVDAPLVIVNRDSKALFESLIPAENRPELFVIDEYQIDDASAPVCENLSIDIAYVLFTSGSTGVPKGVMIPHKAIIDYIDWCVDEYQLDSDDVIANHAPLYFDNSTFDIYTAFKAGTELHLVDDATNAVLPSLIKWLQRNRITTFFCVPSVLTLLARSRRLKPDSFPDLRHIICAGEVLRPDTLRTWMEKYPTIQFTNMYGPTEITVDCSWHVIRDIPSEDCRSIPIGKARTNMELFVRLDDGSLSQAAGATGELLVRGTSVGYGYLGDSDKTAAAFIQNPQNSTFHDPLYCTGDKVEIDTNGDYHFLGRIDDQIKYLGHRIELGEIEAALVSMDCIEEGVVVYKEADELDDCGIGALIRVADDTAVPDIQARLRDLLPVYMLPTTIEATSDEFPRTPNGKYDRKSVSKLVFPGDSG